MTQKDYIERLYELKLKANILIYGLEMMTNKESDEYKECEQKLLEVNRYTMIFKQRNKKFE